MAANDPSAFQASAEPIAKLVFAAAAERYYKVPPWTEGSALHVCLCVSLLPMHPAVSVAATQFPPLPRPPLSLWLLLQVSAEALRVCEQLVRVIRPDVGAPADPRLCGLVKPLFAAVMQRMEAQVRWAGVGGGWHGQGCHRCASRWPYGCNL